VACWPRAHQGSDTLSVDLIDALGKKLAGNPPGAELGRDVSGAGDVNDDGIDDVLIGAHMADDGAGRAYLFLGPIAADHDLSEAWMQLQPGEGIEQLGVVLAGPGDVDNDGCEDLLVHGYGYPEGEGRGLSYLIGGCPW